MKSSSSSRNVFVHARRKKHLSSSHRLCQKCLSSSLKWSVCRRRTLSSGTCAREEGYPVTCPSPPPRRCNLQPRLEESTVTPLRHRLTTRLPPTPQPSRRHPKAAVVEASKRYSAKSRGPIREANWAAAEGATRRRPLHLSRATAGIKAPRRRRRPRLILHSPRNISISSEMDSGQPQRED